MKTGILGGTFDPIHNAHIELANTAMSRMDLDRVIFVPGGTPHRGSGKQDILPARYRCEMVRLAIEDTPGFELYTAEALADHEVFTADTLAELARQYPDDEFFFMVGYDQLQKIGCWIRSAEVFAHAAILAFGRNTGSTIDPEALAADLRSEKGARIVLMDWDGADVSSTAIRADLSAGREDLADIPEKVSAYIREHGLYKPTYSPMDEEEMIERLTQLLKPSRLQHSFNVADEAIRLAEHYGCSTRKARIAGLLHDCAKYRAGALEHAEKGAEMAREEFHVWDDEIIDAIYTHTTGAPGMTMLQKIIFTADYIEPGRDKAPNLELFRTLAYEDIDKTIALISKDTLSYLRQSGAVIDARTEEVYNYYNNCFGKE